MPKLKLDKQSLFALASETRVDILRSLRPMRRTVTQIADELGIDKAGVHRHLRRLSEGDLVRRDEDHGFVYYGLTWKGRDILDPRENTKIVILLTLSILLAATAFVAVLAAQPPNVLMADPGSTGDATRSEDSTYLGFRDDGPFGESLGTSGGWSVAWLLLGLGAGAAGTASVLVAWRRLHRPFQAPPTPS